MSVYSLSFVDIRKERKILHYFLMELFMNLSANNKTFKLRKIFVLPF